MFSFGEILHSFLYTFCHCHGRRSHINYKLYLCVRVILPLVPGGTHEHKTRRSFGNHLHHPHHPGQCLPSELTQKRVTIRLRLLVRSLWTNSWFVICSCG